MDQTGDATETGNNDTELATTSTNEAITDDDKEKANINTIDEGNEDAEQEEQRSPTPEDKGSQVIPQEEEVNKTETEEETRDTFLTEGAEEAEEAEQEQQQEEYAHEEEWEDYSQDGDEKGKKT